MKIKNLAALLFAILLSACSKPLPVEKMNYAGEWRSNKMGLLILADGTVAYKRLQNGGTTSVNGPLKEFEGNDFVVGIGPFSPPLQSVNRPIKPWMVGRWWLMAFV